MEKRKKAMGRPKKPIIQEKFVGFFVTKVQHFVIQQKAKQASVNISDYMRQAAIYGEVKARLTEEERRLFKELVVMSNDIHELVRRAENNGALATMLYFTKYGDLIDNLVNRFSHDQ